MKDFLRSPISLAELTEALMEMTLHKSLGPDGIVTEFYKTMWPIIGEDFYQMLMDSIAIGRLSEGMTKGLIALLHKGGGRNTLNKWRTITILSVAYKIFAKALQIRLQSILNEVINSNQFGFLPIRFILDNIFLTHETIHHARSYAQPLMFLKVDFSKAYD
jgi:hypothetical protein